MYECKREIHELRKLLPFSVHISEIGMRTYRNKYGALFPQLNGIHFDSVVFTWEDKYLFFNSRALHARDPREICRIARIRPDRLILLNQWESHLCSKALYNYKNRAQIAFSEFVKAISNAGKLTNSISRMCSSAVPDIKEIDTEYMRLSKEVSAAFYFLQKVKK